jgi:protein-disulfide isomerase
VYFFNTKKAIESGELQINPETGEVFDPQKLREGTSNYYLGTNNPELTIVMFSDLNCPYCKKAFTVITEEIIKQYSNKIKIIYRDLPIMGKDSIALSLASRCAGEQGKYWNMIDKLFEKQGEFELKELPDIAEQIGVNRLQFINCMAEERYLTAIRQDMKDADTININRTPTYLFNDYKATGHIKKEQFELYINNLLKNN